MQDAIDIKVLQTLSPERKPYFFRSAGPVPRDLSAETKNVRSPEAMDVCC